MMNPLTKVKSFSVLLLCLVLIFQGIPGNVGKTAIAMETSDYLVLSVQSEQPSAKDSAQPLITEEYDPEADRLVVETTQGTDLLALAEAIGGKLVRTGPMDYCMLQFQRTNDPKEAKDILQKTRQFPGVLSASWSKKYQTEGTVEARETIGNVDTIGTVGTLGSGDTKVYRTAVSDPEYSYQWGLQRVRADQAWNEGATGQGVIIAVIDTGVDLDHPDLADSSGSNLVKGYNAITRSAAAGAAQDDNGHGTSVAGLIAALNNNQGIIGVAYNAKIMPIKAMDKNGEGEDAVIADGIIWAVDNGAKIINMSIGSDEETKILDDALQYAANKGCLLIAASGNVSESTSQAYSHQTAAGTSEVSYPAANPNVLAVSAVDSSDVITDFSLTGPEVLLAAPGKRILSDYWSSTETGLGYMTGTSIAAPFVTGAAALIWSKYPGLTADQIRQALIESAYDLGQEGRDDNYGYGRLDIYRALKTFGTLQRHISPAALGWEGGIVSAGSAGEEPAVELSVSVGTFALQVNSIGTEKKINISISEAISPGGFPKGIISGSEAYSISWGEALPEKVLNLSIKTELSGSAMAGTESGYLASLYRWSGSRWIRVGGGFSADSKAVEVSIYEPGTYKVGWSPAPDTDRIAGPDRILTALAIAAEAFPTGADTVMIARADDFPDALAGAPLAYKYHAPVLLTYPNELPQEVFQAVQDLNPNKIILLGGTSAVSETVEAKLSGVAAVQRLAGSNRYDTAAALADMLGTKGQAVVVSGANFPDAIAAASYAAVEGKPILLTSSSILNSETQLALKKSSVTATEVIGGNGAVSGDVMAELPSPVRVSGTDRFATSAAVLKEHKTAGQAFYIATGMNYPDALTGGILAATGSSNILLVSQSGLSAGQKTLLSSYKGKTVIAIGGTKALPDTVIAEIRRLGLL
ncbi:S8 family serine peptidase [Dehalobacter sp.]|uniref:S8 family serine peptidase n=1 Tax=Dehalobacter sp. TaxID=1962289 RepID=UPI00258EC38D|nr:S8 family serine peptidase [Dehalobacter sp.]MCG1024849.1 S8 family serine peptidase [Dehalobacter sp.]